MQNLKITLMPVAELIPYVNNARTHSEEQINQIASSIKEYGFVNPILIGDDKVIIAGHGRLLAAIKMGLQEVPAITLAHLSPTQRRALVIADNKIALNAGWDPELLRMELQELSTLDYSMDLLGFSVEELDALMIEDSAGNTDDDQIPEVPEEPIAKPGDMWKLGNHMLLCGDSTQLGEVEKVMAGALADMVFTDPPYNVNYGHTMKETLRGKRGSKNAKPIMNDNLKDAFPKFLYDVSVNILAVCKGAVYVCMSSSELHTLQKAFTDAGGKWSTFIIWAKNTFTIGKSDYQRQYEPILYGWKDGDTHYWCGARNQGDVWSVNKPVKNDLHPTMKPVELCERAINNSSKSRDIVLDLFGGSGSTMIACEKLGRSCRMIELDPKYCDVIIKRWEDYSGKKAEIVS